MGILIIEDDRDLCESIKNVLKEHGLSSLCVYDGGSAISCIEKERPDLIILDIMMPGIDGFEVAHRLKHNEMFKDIPIIVISVLQDKESKMAAFKAGADDYFTKPFDPDELIISIKRNLKIREFTKRIQKEISELKEKERLKALVLSHVSHDFSCILQEITKELDLLLSSFYGKLNEEQGDVIKKLSLRCSDILNLLSSFLDIVKIDSGRIWIDIKEFPLDELISVIEKRCKNEAEKKGLIFKAIYPKAMIKTDKVKLIRILEELVFLVIKFQEKGDISLIVKEDNVNSTFIFNVSFKTFLNEEYIREMMNEEIRIGSKIELVLVKKLVSLLRGNISISKDSTGSRFTIILPKNIEYPARRKEDRSSELGVRS